MFKRFFSNKSIKYSIGKDLILTQRQLCDLECISNNSFNPLNNFLNKRNYESVVNDFRLTNGKLWPIPIYLDVNKEVVESLEKNNNVLCLRDPEFNILATMNVDDIWERDKKKEGKLVFGGDPEHPAIIQLEKSGNYLVSGELNMYQSPIHYDYNHIRHTPEELKKILPTNKPVVAFQTRNPMHKAHMELVGAAAKSVDGIALIHPVVGETKPGDIDYHTRIKCYQSVLKDGILKTQSGNIDCILSLLPLSMRMAGPREALWHALIRENHGATHFICGRDHAGPGSNSAGIDFYTPYEARDFVMSHQNELNIDILSFEMMVYLKESKHYIPISKATKTDTIMKLSGTQVRNKLKDGEDIPEWFSDKNVVKILKENHPPRKKQGFTLFFTGLSGSGKSTIANGLLSRLHEEINTPITLLDGDEVRNFLSSELTFSDEHRDLNIRRIGYVASLINKSRGIAVCAAIAPFKKSRNAARDIVEENKGNFIEIYIDADLEICENRDRKGLYKKARDGIIKNFTGIGSEYEIPENPDIKINSAHQSASESVDTIIKYLKDNNYI